MKKYECCKCTRVGATPCVIEWYHFPLLPPLYCPGSGDEADWHEVVESPPLPGPTIKDSFTVPEWCKVGKWVCAKTQSSYGGQSKLVYGKVFELLRGGKGASVTLDGKSVIGAFDINHLRPARLRPWTFEEAPMQLKVILEEYDRLNCGNVISGVVDLVDELSTHGDRSARFKIRDSVYWEDATNSLVTGGFISAAQLAVDYVQLDGSPCGVLEIAEASK